MSVYFEEQQIVDACAFLTTCKEKSKKDEDYCNMPCYFDKAAAQIPRVYGITLRAEYKDSTETYYLFVTPHYEVFRFELLRPDYEIILSTGFVVDKVKELLEGQGKYVVKVDNRKDIYSGSLYEGFYYCEESKCFVYSN